MRRKKINVQQPKTQAISLHSDISMQMRNNRHVPTFLIRCVLSLLGIVCAIMVVQGFYQFTFNLKQVLLFSTAATFVCDLIYNLPRKFHRLIVILLLAFEMVLYNFWMECLSGYRSVYRTITAQIHHLSRELNDTALFTERMNVEQCTTFFFCAFLFIIVLCLTYFVVMKPNFIFVFLLTFPFLESGLLFGYLTSSVAVFGLVAFWISVLVLQLAGSKIAHRHICRNRKKRGLYFSKMGRQFAAAELSSLFVLILTMAGSFVVIRATQNYERSEKIDHQRGVLQAKFSNITFKDITGLIREIPIPYEVNLLVDDVELANSGDVHFAGGDVLTVTFPNLDNFSDMYLKGIARGEYTGSGWKQLKDAYRNEKSLLKKFAEQKRYPQTLDFYLSSDLQSVGKMKVRALHQEQVNYLPNEMLSYGQDFRNVLFDTELRLDSQIKYEFDYAPYLVQDWSKLSFGNKDTRSHIEILRSYEEFVADAYGSTEQNADLEESLFAPFRAYYEASGTHSTYEDVLQTVRDYIWERADYTLSPGDTPDNADFVTYFLNENHAGYCAHYASTAVLLCRSIGIPARYCQGYVVSQADYFAAKDKTASKKEVKVDVHDFRAHAWAEIFVPAVGWMPYEFTEDVAAGWSHSANPSDVAVTTSVPFITTLNSTNTTTASELSETSDSALTTTLTETTTTASSDENDDKESILSATQIKILLTILVVFLLLVLAVMLWRQHHTNVVARRTHRMRTGSNNLAARYSYAFLMQLLELHGVSQGNLQHEQYAVYVEEHCKLLPKGAMAEAVAIQQKVVFSGTEITKEETERIFEIAQNLAKSIYDSADKKQRFHLRWFKHIVQ